MKAKCDFCGWEYETPYEGEYYCRTCTKLLGNMPQYPTSKQPLHAMETKQALAYCTNYLADKIESHFKQLEDNFGLHYESLKMWVLECGHKPAEPNGTTLPNSTTKPERTDETQS